MRFPTEEGAGPTGHLIICWKETQRDRIADQNRPSISRPASDERSANRDASAVANFNRLSLIPRGDRQHVRFDCHWHGYQRRGSSSNSRGYGCGRKCIDIRNAFALGSAIADEGWIVLNGGRNRGVMDAVSKGAKASGGFTVGILPTKDRRTISTAVHVAIITDTGSARNYINVLTSDVVVACGADGPGTASEIALALKSDKFVVLLNSGKESRAFFKKIGGRLVLETDSVSKAIDIIRLLLAKMRKTSTRTIIRQI
jgi:uncharacterized protein (TIGR00725 family)